MRKQFLKHLALSLKSSGAKLPAGSDDEIQRTTDRFFEQHSKPTDGPAEKLHLELACLILASYQYLSSHGFDSRATREALLASLIQPNRKAIKWGTKAMLFLSTDPMRTLVNYSKRRVRPMYGSGFEFREEGSERDVYTIYVTRCFYSKFFNEHGLPELAQLFCQWDRAWIDQISENKHNVRFTRSETIATGGEECPFRFERL